MLAVHEQNGAEAGMVESGQQRRLLAEIARERDRLEVEAVGAEPLRCGKRPVAAAVVDIDHLGGKPARRLQAAGDLDDTPVQTRDVAGLVEQRHHDRQAGLGAAARPRAFIVGCHVPAFPGYLRPFRRLIAQRQSKFRWILRIALHCLK